MRARSRARRFGGLLAGVALALAAASVLAAGPPARHLLGVRSGPWEDRFRIVLDLSEPTPYRSVVATGPDRVVIVIPGMMGEGTPAPELDPRFVSGLRIDDLPDTMRLEISLTSALRCQVFTVPPGDGKPFRIVCDVYHPTPLPASAERQASSKTPASPPAKEPPRLRESKEAAKAPPPVKVPEPMPLPERQAPAEPRETKEAKAPAPGTMGTWTIYIDPGHGGHDPGAMQASMQEKRITLDVARRLAKRLSGEPGVVARLTREGDTGVALGRRVRRAEEGGADAFVSVHVNGCKDRSARGAEVFFLSLGGASDAATREVETLENAADAGEDTALTAFAHLPFGADLLQTDTLRRSSLLAESILGVLEESGFAASRGVKQANFAVLRSARIPSALVEVGFLSNPGDAERLASPEHREALAETIARGLLEYRSRYARQQPDTK
jgi:N-acetylmuramoyl-L-alanine amidase